MENSESQTGPTSETQLELDFAGVIRTAEVFSRDEVAARAHTSEATSGYSPVSQTAAYMQRAVELEDAWETTIRVARDELLSKDPRELYFEFISDLKKFIEQDNVRSGRYADLLEQVAVRGLGMTRRHVQVDAPNRGGVRWRVKADLSAIQDHLAENVVGTSFLNELVIDPNERWKGQHPVIGASDVSQHRSAVPVPARYFKRSVPFVLNNAAGTLYRLDGQKPKYDNVFNPRPDEALLRWMLIDPSYQDELDPEDYERCVASAMDVGQYKFDLEYLLKADRRAPEIVFRDGSLFPQDAYLDNFAIETRRGVFTREAIIELLNCLTYAKAVGVIYCGVTKGVQLKVYSALLDWYISKYIDNNWEIGHYTLNDGQSMSMLLASPDFVGDHLSKVIATCLIKRCFTTRANLNTRASLDDLDAYFDSFAIQHPEVDITPFRSLCGIANEYMFFLGHSKSPQQQLPRYEFFYSAEMGEPTAIAAKVLHSLQSCGLMNDSDHSFMADAPITYMMPAVTQQAHLLSKDVGKYIDRATGQWIMAKYQSLLRREG